MVYRYSIGSVVVNSTRLLSAATALRYSKLADRGIARCGYNRDHHWWVRPARALPLP